MIFNIVLSAYRLKEICVYNGPLLASQDSKSYLFLYVNTDYRTSLSDIAFSFARPFCTVDCVHISPSPLIFTMPLVFGGPSVPLPVATIISPLFVTCMNLPL